MRFIGLRCAAVFIIQLVLIESCSCITLKGFVGVFTAAFNDTINYLKRTECDAVVLDYEGLKQDMNTKLHGQHLVTPTVIKSIRAHTNDPNPGKALVLSFHGSSGEGKNFVAQTIRDNLYKKEASKHFHLFSSAIHFKHESKVAEYKDQLHSWIYHNVSNCARSMFVFDEMDQMPTRIIDVLTPFLSHNTEIDGVDFRKTIFIFLRAGRFDSKTWFISKHWGVGPAVIRFKRAFSNTGGIRIMDIVLKHWQNGKTRESLRLFEMQETLEMVAYNDKSGLKRSKLISKNLIDHFVPFLPLERIHVRSCIVDLVKQKGYKGITEDIIEEILDHQIGWKTKDVKMFSKTGCKKIEQIVALMRTEETED